MEMFLWSLLCFRLCFKYIVTEGGNWNVSLCSGLCGCCWALRPRYKRLVDNIFPEDPEVNTCTSTTHSLYIYFSASVSNAIKIQKCHLYFTYSWSFNKLHSNNISVCICVCAIRKGWWKPTWRSWPSSLCLLRRSSTALLRTCQSVWPESWTATATGQYTQTH